MATNTNTIPDWKASGDWFDVCKCNIPCPYEFAQAPTYGDCNGVLPYHVKKGNYGQTPLDGLNVLLLTYFKGNIWAGDTKFDCAFYFDERADEKQREALNMIFTGKAGGFMAEFAKLVGEVKGMDYAPIKFNIADDLSYWSAEIPGKVLAKAEALTGPTTPPGKRVQTINPPGSEVGPGAAGAVATWGKAITNEVDAMGAAISDIAHPKWRATSLGVYRFWRDLGFVFGAIGIGLIADLLSISIAIQVVAWIAIASGVFVLLIMKETRKV